MRLRLIAAACSIAALQVPAVTSARATRGQESIAAGVAVQRDLAGGQTHTYELPFAGEQCVRVAVVQHGIDVAVSIRDRGGAPLVEENRLDAQGTEVLVWTSPVRASTRSP